MTTASASNFKFLNVLRKATRRVIKLDSRTIVLVPHTKTRTPSGAFTKTAGTPRAAQVFALEPIPGANTLESQDGIKTNVWWYYLVGEYTAIVEVGDEWKDGTMTYEVVVPQPFNGYEKRYLVRAYGSEPNYGS